MTNGGNLNKTARELDIPRTTLRKYRDQQASLVEGLALATSDPDRARDIVQLWEDTHRAAVHRVNELLPQTTRLHDVAYAAMVASNAFLDHHLGRKGAAVDITVDARSVSLPVGMTADEARQIADQLSPRDLPRTPTEDDH